MSSYDRAADLLQPGESAVALLTRGKYLALQPDGLSTSGNWKMKPRNLDKVIIYNELSGMRQPRADIYLADYVDAVKSPEEGRYIVRFRAYTIVGTTNQSWKDFADANQNPVRYVKG